MVNEPVEEPTTEAPAAEPEVPAEPNDCPHPAEEDAHQGDIIEDGKRFAHYICRLCGRERKEPVDEV